MTDTEIGIPISFHGSFVGSGRGKNETIPPSWLDTWWRTRRPVVVVGCMHGGQQFLDWIEGGEFRQSSDGLGAVHPHRGLARLPWCRVELLRLLARHDAMRAAPAFRAVNVQRASPPRHVSGRCHAHTASVPKTGRYAATGNGRMN